MPIRLCLVGGFEGVPTQAAGEGRRPSPLEAASSFLCLSLGLNNTIKRTRKREFLDAMELVVPWAELMALI